jgi:hypothetical protein
LVQLRGETTRLRAEELGVLLPGSLEILLVLGIDVEDVTKIVGLSDLSANCSSKANVGSSSMCFNICFLLCHGTVDKPLRQ